MDIVRYLMLTTFFTVLFILIAQLIMLAKLQNWPGRIYNSLPWVRRRREREIQEWIDSMPEFVERFNRSAREFAKMGASADEATRAFQRFGGATQESKE